MAPESLTIRHNAGGPEVVRAACGFTVVFVVAGYQKCIPRLGPRFRAMTSRVALVSPEFRSATCRMAVVSKSRRRGAVGRSQWPNRRADRVQVNDGVAREQPDGSWVVCLVGREGRLLPARGRFRNQAQAVTSLSALVAASDGDRWVMDRDGRTHPVED